MPTDDFAEGWTQALGKLAAGIVGAVEEACHEGADEARRTHRYVDRTGDATRTTRGEVMSIRSDSAQGRLICDVPYGKILADGSRPHRIEPKDPDGYLAFQQDGQWRRSKGVNHPGTRPDPFMDLAMAKADRVLETAVDQAVEHAFSAAGFD